MSGNANTAKWVGKWLLQIPVYLVTAYLMRELLGSCYRLLIKAGANLPPNFLLQHFLWVALIGGFIAGVAGIVAFRAMLLLPIRFEPASGRPWGRPQAWTWVLPACWLAYGMIVWSAKHTHRSVLAVEGVGHPGVIVAFFGAACSIPATAFAPFDINDCMTQITYAHPWLGTLGYSAAAFVPTGWLRRTSATQNPESECVAGSETGGEA